MNDLISIIIPVYNVEKYLKDCLESVIMQTYPNLEIILVDDGATDNCPQICDEYAKKDKRIKVIHRENAGLSSARNSGIDIAKGEYIMFVDSDDTIESNTAKDLYRLSKRYNTKIAICGRRYVFDDGKRICKVKEKIECKFSFEDAIREMNRYYYFDMSAHGKLFNRELFRAIRFPVGKLSEDFFIMPSLFKLAGNISYTSEPLYNYLQRKNSITKNKKINEDFLEAAKKQAELLEKESSNLKTIIHVAYASAALTVFDSYIKNGGKCSEKKVRHFNKIVKDEWKYIKEYSKLDHSKKIQFRLFVFSVPIYKSVFRIFRKIRRV